MSVSLIIKTATFINLLKIYIMVKTSLTAKDGLTLEKYISTTCTHCTDTGLAKQDNGRKSQLTPCKTPSRSRQIVGQGKSLPEVQKEHARTSTVSLCNCGLQEHSPLKSASVLLHTFVLSIPDLEIRNSSKYE